MAGETDTTSQGDERARRGWEAEADEEQVVLSRHTAFRAMLARTAEAKKQDGGMTLHELHDLLGLIPEYEAEGERLLAELERQTEAEEAARLAARHWSAGWALDTGRCAALAGAECLHIPLPARVQIGDTEGQVMVADTWYGHTARDSTGEVGDGPRSGSAARTC